MSKHIHITKEVTDVGDTVLCDACCEGFTAGDTRSGGFLFGSKAYCPTCAKNSLPRIRGYGEEHFTKAWCPPTMSFRDWVLSLRNGNNKVTVTTIETTDE